MHNAPHTARFRFLDSLNDFLRDADRRKTLEIPFRLSPSVKDVIEAQGVPHVEVYAIRVNGRRQDFSYNLNSGDEVEVYPKESVPEPGHLFDLKPAERLPERLVADVHMGKTARLLRLMGVDTRYDNANDEIEIIRMAEEEQRGVLSRDLGLLKHGRLGFGYWPRSEDPLEQTVETLVYFELENDAGLEPLDRCMECNGLLEPAAPEEVVHQVPEGVKAWSKEYRRCTACGKIYWKGSHYKKLVRTVTEIRERVALTLDQK